MNSVTSGETKRCAKCGEVKPAGEFYAARRGALGRRSDCKRCANRYHNEWARRRYVPKTGRRYRTRRHRAAEAARAAAGSRPAKIN